MMQKDKDAEGEKVFYGQSAATKCIYLLQKMGLDRYHPVSRFDVLLQILARFQAKSYQSRRTSALSSDADSFWWFSLSFPLKTAFHETSRNNWNQTSISISKTYQTTWVLFLRAVVPLVPGHRIFLATKTVIYLRKWPLLSYRQRSPSHQKYWRARLQHPRRSITEMGQGHELTKWPLSQRPSK